MKQIIREILDGNFRVENGSLNFSCPRIDLSVPAGEVFEDSFTVYGPEGVVTEGYVISSDLRVECLTASFRGSQDEIFYRVDTSKIEAGTEIKGAFHMISNQGEYYLPFCVVAAAPVIESGLGEIRNLFHFTNLAKTNWPEAVNLFYSREFERIFRGNAKTHYAAYKGLSAIYGNEHNVEEFLLEINKKKAVEFIPEEKQIRIENPAVNARYTLVVNRNGWGYTNLQIETDGDFLRVERQHVSDDAFLGNLYRLYYYIQSDGLHAGNNYGAIRLISFEKVVEVPVTVVCGVQNRRKMLGLYQEKKRITIRLMQYYQACRLKKISTKTWMEETERLLEHLKDVEGLNLPARLFQIQLFITQERFKEAEWALERDEEAVALLREDQPELWCYYLYLTALCSKNDAKIDEISDIIVRAYERNRGNWRIAWLLLFLSDRYISGIGAKWELLEELFSFQCYSPVIYMEAWHLLCMNPAMLLKLGDFELQILNYASKSEVMKDDIIIQILYLAQKQKGYSELLFRILTACYHNRPQSDILHAICATLIKGNKYGSRYFSWYRAGVEQNLRITRLYEYYMMSVPLDGKEKLPKMVLMYFSYQCDLNYEITAGLYAYVIKNQNELPDIYESYLPAIEQFVIAQIKRGRMNKHLAYLYRNIIVQPMMDEELAQELMNLLFMQEITVQSDAIRQAVAVYPYGTKQMVYPVSGARAQVPVYDADCKILLEDEAHNRYTVSIPFTRENLITTGKLSSMAAPFIREHLGYDIHVCFDHKNGLVIQEKNVEHFKRLINSGFLEETDSQMIRMELVRFYYDRDRMWELDEYLFSLQPEEIAGSDRKEIVRIMVLRGMYTEAFDWLHRISPYGVDSKTLVKLCSRLLGLNGQNEDSLMTGIIYDVAKKGKYDEQILKYLVKFFNGSIRDMRDFWKTAQDYGIDTYELSERILVQMLYTGSYFGEKADIFHAYWKGGGKEEVVAAVISQSSYDYVIKEKVTEPFLIESIFKMHQEKGELHLVCKIALLKYYAENPKEITEQSKEVIREFLQDLLSRQIILPLFKEYTGYLPALDILQDKSILEYRARPGQRVTIHYLIQKEDGGGQEYCRETMKEMFAGICVKEFILFFGERLQYYITEDDNGREQPTQSGTISRNDNASGEQAGSRFHLLNDIMIGMTLQDYDTVDHLLEEYYKKDFMADQLFTIQ